MTRIRTVFAVVTAAALALTLATKVDLVGEASGREKADPTTLNLKAIELSQDGAYMEAIEIWLTILHDQGPRYAHASVVHRNIGRNYQKLGLLPPAWWHLKSAVELADGGAEKPALWLFETSKKLEKTHVKVAVAAPRPNDRFIFEEQGKYRSYPAPLVWWFKKGQHKVTVRAVTGKLTQHPVTVTADTRSVSLVAASPPIKDSPPDKSNTPGKITTTTWTLLGAGALLAASGGVTFAVAASKLSDLEADYDKLYSSPLSTAQYQAVSDQWDSDVSSQIRGWEIASWTLWAAGAGTLAAGGVMLYLDLTGEDKNSSSVQILPLLGDVNGVSFGFTF